MEDKDLKQAEKIISRIRNAHPDNYYLYREGQCYNFALILKAIYPEAELFYSKERGHVYTMLDSEHFFDISGRIPIDSVPEDAAVIDDNFMEDERPWLWGLNDHRRLK